MKRIPPSVSGVRFWQGWRVLRGQTRTPPVSRSRETCGRKPPLADAIPGVDRVGGITSAAPQGIVNVTRSSCSHGSDEHKLPPNSSRDGTWATAAKPGGSILVRAGGSAPVSKTDGSEFDSRRISPHLGWCAAGRAAGNPTSGPGQPDETEAGTTRKSPAP